MIKRIDEFIGRAFETATKHGFHDKKISVEHMLMLVISEISEAVEADRKNRHANLDGFEKCVGIEYSQRFKDYVKDSVEDELADVCIRLFDLCGALDIEPYQSKEEIPSLADDWNESFGDLSFCEQAYCLVSSLIVFNPCMEDDLSHGIGAALYYIHYWALYLGIDLVRHIELKMKYNESRQHLHGKAY